MAVSIETRSIIDTYRQRAKAPRFLSTFATRKVFQSDEIELEVVREEEDVAIVLRDVSNSANYNVFDQYTNKRMKPPPYGEAALLEASKLDLQKQFGNTPYDTPEFQAIATSKCFDVFDLLVAKMRRAGELQMSQLFANGTLQLFAPDRVADAPLVRFELDFDARASHFADVGAAWSGASTKLDDLGDHAHTIKMNGRTTSDFDLIFGRTASRNFFQDSTVLSLLDNRNLDVGRVQRPQQIAGGGTYHGEISVDGFNFKLWTYDEYYKDSWTTPSAPEQRPYVADTHVLFRASDMIFRAAFGNVSRFGSPEGEVLKYLPPIMSDGLYTFSPFAFLSPNKKTLDISADTRMLFYPLSLDHFGRLETEPA